MMSDADAGLGSLSKAQRYRKGLEARLGICSTSIEIVSSMMALERRFPGLRVKWNERRDGAPDRFRTLFSKMIDLLLVHEDWLIARVQKPDEAPDRCDSDIRCYKACIELVSEQITQLRSAKAELSRFLAEDRP
jgi:hypothetical protein